MIKEICDAAYIIPVRIKGEKKEVALLKYKDGYGKIGGRCDGVETPRETLRREICEELGEAVAFLADMAKESRKPYEFKNSEDGINSRGAKGERHFIFVVKIPNEIELMFCEEREDKVKVVWLPLVSLTDKDIIVYPDLRDYYAKHVLPILEDLT
jgi:8-oxo-dGTP pyrophosphatase MutT (NUDIX family)